MTSHSTRRAALIAALASGVLFASTQIQFAQQPGQQPAPGAAAAPAQRGGRGPDPRIQQRTYTFKDTNEEMPYAVFVSSKVSKDKKAPLIVALHGLGGNQNTMLGAGALQLAEEGGYIVLGVMGYNSSGWYGAPAGMAAGTGGAAGGANGLGGGRGGAGGGAGRGAAPGGAPGGAPGVLPVVLPELDLDLARDAVLVPADRAVRPELARAEAEAWGPTYRVIRRYPPRTEAWEPLVQVVAEARQQPWVRRTRPVRTVRRKR